tara:strand:- start:153 stop:389 length:237 start_codon:yes stop_codon:yes gene_type:complete
MQNKIITIENPNGTLVDMTAEEITARETELSELSALVTAREEQEQADKTAKDNLKASAKAKLIAGEALTAEEADTIVL